MHTCFYPHAITPRTLETQARYLTTFTGQHDVPWAVLSAIFAASGNVPAEYVLASTIASAFFTLDIALRVINVCEEQGIGKGGIAPAIPIYAIMTALSYAVYRQMS